jgi:hypothetical protein
MRITSSPLLVVRFSKSDSTETLPVVPRSQFGAGPFLSSDPTQFDPNRTLRRVCSFYRERVIQPGQSVAFAAQRGVLSVGQCQLHHGPSAHKSQTSPTDDFRCRPLTAPPNHGCPDFPAPIAIPRSRVIRMHYHGDAFPVGHNVESSSRVKHFRSDIVRKL